MRSSSSRRAGGAARTSRVRTFTSRLFKTLSTTMQASQFIFLHHEVGHVLTSTPIRELSSRRAGAAKAALHRTARDARRVNCIIGS
jgi:hypothetical protein